MTTGGIPIPDGPWLSWLTLALFALGTAASVLAWTRGKAPLASVTVLCGLGLARQVALLIGSESAPELADAALLGMAGAAVFALRAIRRTTRERNRSEDLHWDAMETVRALTEVTGASVSEREPQLVRLLALGAARFRLEYAYAWQVEAGAGSLLARHPGEDGDGPEPPPVPVERLELAAQASRPLLLVDETPSPTRVFFGAPIQLAGRTLGSVGFVGSRHSSSRFAATDKDLLNLLAQCLAIELRRRETPRPERGIPEPEREAPKSGREVPEPEREAPTGPPPRPAAKRRGGDVNAAVQRSEARLRRRVGADGRLELSLAAGLPRTRVGRTALPALIEALVEGAVKLSPNGRIRVTTAQAGDVTLSVQVEGEGIDEAALAGAIGTGLADLERRLRVGGGDLSVSLEPPHRAVLTAYLPPAEDRPAARAPAPGAPPTV